MNDCIKLEKSNCKNCYKCIKYCPVKSIKMENDQAAIIENECILCGRCIVNCPQNAKYIRNDLNRAKELIKSGKPVYASVAPSFYANFNVEIGDMEAALKKLGFAGAEETAVGATIVKKEYERLIESREQSVIVSTCCHSVIRLVQRHYPELIKYLAKVVSPMQAHAMKLKEEHEGCGVIFIGPCVSKKDEIERKGITADCVLTFEELSEWLESEKIELENTGADCENKGRARWFPTAGGILNSMDFDKDYTYIAVDGAYNCIKALKDLESGNLENCFIEMSICTGSCIGGPVMNKAHAPLEDFVAVKKHTVDYDHRLDENISLELNREYPYEGIIGDMPGSAVIDEILKKMGKTSKEQELNCGSCGYNTCREKAIAVYQGKADLNMCLPYLKEKAISFSDTIINNTPNGIIVLNENLEIQQLNAAALKILNIRKESDVLNNPIVRILDPTDYVLAIAENKNIYEKSKYYIDYQKYVEETVIYDKEYHIVMILMKDITEEQRIKNNKETQSQQAIEITDKVVEKQMRVVQEIASLLGETTAETKIALTKLKETLQNE